MKYTKTYLYKLYAQSKLLFAIMVICCISTVIAAYLTKEQFPFLLYGMYSLPETPPSKYVMYQVQISGKPIVFSKLPDAQRELIETTLKNAIKLKDENRISETEWRKFVHWLFVYCSDMRTIEENTLEIIEQTGHYNRGMPVVEGKKVIYSYNGS